MIEVFLVGSFVSYSRIKAVSNVTVEVGGWALVAAGLVLLVAIVQLDERTVWEMLRPQRRDPDRESAKDATVACIICDLIVGYRERRQALPAVRREAPCAQARIPPTHGGIRVCRIPAVHPANTLPVLTTVQFGREEHNTILSGVIELDAQ